MKTQTPLQHTRTPSHALASALAPLALAALLGMAACGGNPSTDGGGPESPDEPTAAPSAASEDAAGADGAGEVTYEPAYPEDASDEGLTAADTETQEAAHSHGDEGAHSHDGTEDHEHGDDGDHDHGGGDDHGHEH